MLRILLFTFIISACFGSMKGQTVEQFNAWYMYFGNHKLNEKVNLHTEYQFRRSGLIADWQQSLSRVGLDYNINNSTMATAGYGWIVSFPYGEQAAETFSTEHRIWQQLILKQKSGSVGIQHRYRLEQRFLENASINSNDERVVDGFRFRQRARYRAMISIPLSKKTMVDNTLFLAIYDEVFLGFGEGISQNILDQNRLYFALGWRFNKMSNVQLGYLYHRVFKADGIRRENNHTLQVAFTKNFDFSKG